MTQQSASTFPIILSLLPAILILLSVVLGIRYRLKSIQPIRIPDVISPDGFKVPIVGGYWGTKSLPKLVALAHNNANPLLVLYEDRILTRAIFSKKTYAYQQIEKVDVTEAIMTENINLYIRDSNSIVSFNVYSRDNLREVVGFLDRKGISLTENARRFISSQ